MEKITNEYLLALLLILYKGTFIMKETFINFDNLEKRKGIIY